MKYHENYDRSMDHISTVFYQMKEVLVSIWGHFLVKAIGAGLIATGSFLFGAENYDMILFLGALILIDLITGMMAAVHQGQPIESRKAFKTATKAIVYLLFFSASFLAHKIVPFSDFIYVGVLSFLAITELLSVMENMAKMGYAIPAKLLNQIKEKGGMEISKKKHKGFGTGRK